MEILVELADSRLQYLLNVSEDEGPPFGGGRRSASAGRPSPELSLEHRHRPSAPRHRLPQTSQGKYRRCLERNSFFFLVVGASHFAIRLGSSLEIPARRRSAVAAEINPCPSGASPKRSSPSSAPSRTRVAAAAATVDSVCSRSRIEADFGDQILILQRFSSTTRF